jgi:site-specific DNA-adenine methylase
MVGGAATDRGWEVNTPITTLVPWFGNNRTNAHMPAQLLAECNHVTIPFAGGMPEVAHFRPTVQLLVCDLHDDLLHLARVVRDECDDLAAMLEERLFHPGELEQAASRLAIARENNDGALFASSPKPEYDDVLRAADYFTVAWMGRSAASGTAGELNTGLAVRYSGSGGSSVTRFRNAVAGLQAWRETLKRCQFVRQDCFTTLANVFSLGVRGTQGIGIYCDPPWPDDGDCYRFAFSEQHQRRLAKMLMDMGTNGFHISTVVRFGDHPLIRELYPASDWIWHMADGRTQANTNKREVFLERRKA